MCMRTPFRVRCYVLPHSKKIKHNKTNRTLSNILATYTQWYVSPTMYRFTFFIVGCVKILSPAILGKVCHASTRHKPRTRLILSSFTDNRIAVFTQLHQSITYSLVVNTYSILRNCPHYTKLVQLYYVNMYCIHYIIYLNFFCVDIYKLYTVTLRKGVLPCYLSLCMSVTRATRYL